jgi:hypothetical protein
MQVQEGEGWRWLVDPARHPFSVLVGGQGWASELTAEEALGLGQGLVQLVHEHHALASQLLPDESICLELERGPVWIALEGDRKAWTLRFVLTPESGCRAIEGSWLPAASAALVAALNLGGGWQLTRVGKPARLQLRPSGS